MIRNDILEGLVRPQRPFECSVNTVAGAINSLFGKSLDRDDVLSLADWDVDDVVAGNMGNDDVLEAIERICKRKKCSVTTDVLFRSIPLLPASSNRLWNEFKRQVMDEKTVLIYHAENHYTLIAGFLEDPQCRYVVLAEHSEDWDPIRTITWNQLRKQLMRYRGYGMLRVRRG